MHRCSHNYYNSVLRVYDAKKQWLFPSAARESVELPVREDVHAWARSPWRSFGDNCRRGNPILGRRIGGRLLPRGNAISSIIAVGLPRSRQGHRRRRRDRTIPLSPKHALAAPPLVVTACPLVASVRIGTESECALANTGHGTRRRRLGLEGCAMMPSGWRPRSRQRLLAGREITTINLSRWDELVFTIELEPDEGQLAWRAGRSVREQTGRWPVVVNATRMVACLTLSIRVRIRWAASPVWLMRRSEGSASRPSRSPRRLGGQRSGRWISTADEVAAQPHKAPCRDRART